MTAVSGVRLGVAQAGVKKPGRDDVTLIELPEGSVCAGMFTLNQFCAAPVHVAKANLADSGHSPRYWLINTGNANAGTGEGGMAAAKACCHAVAEKMGVDASLVLPFSTGVIGEPLPVQKIVDALPAAIANLSETEWERAAGAIMTTDTRAKMRSVTFEVGSSFATITGITKGAGMICPNMATMLGFVATDIKISADLLQKAWRDAVNSSFNRVTVDGDTSTNDAAVIAATQRGDVAVSSTDDESYAVFVDALTTLSIELAQELVRDGEGATKFVTVDVRGGKTLDECSAVAYTIAHSPLVKTALFASDPNWGRLLAAIGRAGLDNLVVEDVGVYINGVLIAENGARAASYTEEQGVKAMAETDIVIRVELNRGDVDTQVWTSDLSYDYVKINAEYRT